jgi:hypothetical protein
MIIPAGGSERSESDIYSSSTPDDEELEKQQND